MDLNNIIVSVVLSVVSSAASFIMGGIWMILKNQKKQAEDLNIAFKKIRAAETAIKLLEESYESGDGEDGYGPSYETYDGDLPGEDDCPRPDCARQIYKE